MQIDDSYCATVEFIDKMHVILMKFRIGNAINQTEIRRMERGLLDTRSCNICCQCTVAMGREREVAAFFLAGRCRLDSYIVAFANLQRIQLCFLGQLLIFFVRLDPMNMKNIWIFLKWHSLTAFVAGAPLSLDVLPFVAARTVNL